MLDGTHFLQLNKNKSEIVLFCPRDTINIIQKDLDQLAPYIKSHDICVIFDSALNYK